MKPPATFETPRLRLRPPDADDAAAIFMTWAQDATVSRYMNWRPHRSLDDTRVFLHYCAEGWEHGGPFNWVIALPENGPPIGTIELRPQGHRLEMGYVLARSWWGRGFMTEVARGLVEWALAQPEVHRVWAVCDVENTAWPVSSRRWEWSARASSGAGLPTRTSVWRPATAGATRA